VAKRISNVLFVEDELSILYEFTQILKRLDHHVLAASRPDEVLRIIQQEDRIDVAVMDLQLPMRGCKKLGPQEAAGGRHAGLVLARELRRKFPEVQIIFWTGSREADLRARVLELGNTRLIPKDRGPDPVLDSIADIAHGRRTASRPKTFVVHGHDEQTRKELCDYLTGALGFPAPTVLRDEPSYGRTIIEKLEGYTHSIDLVFVLLTPDDQVLPSSACSRQPSEEVFRSRQNVIFELGYFLGLLGRSTGRVILLYRGELELPSDISGMISIDITDGVLSADGAIRRELVEWL
jgi:CheY-like chemotaxis protein